MGGMDAYESNRATQTLSISEPLSYISQTQIPNSPLNDQEIPTHQKHLKHALRLIKRQAAMGANDTSYWE